MAERRLSILTLAGELCEVSVAERAMVEDVKLAIQAEAGIPYIEQRLVHGVVELRSGALPPAGEAGAAGLPTQLLLIRRSPEEAHWLREAECSYCACALADAPAALLEDRGFMLAAVSENGMALQWAADSLRADRDIVLAAVSQDPTALSLAADALRGDREIVRVATEQDGCQLCYAAEELRADRDIVLAAVSQNPAALIHAAETLRADREIVRVATEQDGSMLCCAAKELRADRDFVLKGIAQDGLAVRWAAKPLRDEVLTAVWRKGFVLRYRAPVAHVFDNGLPLVNDAQNRRALSLTAEALLADKKVPVEWRTFLRRCRRGLHRAWRGRAGSACR